MPWRLRVVKEHLQHAYHFSGSSVRTSLRWSFPGLIDIGAFVAIFATSTVTAARVSVPPV